MAIAPGIFAPQNTAKWRTLTCGLTFNEKREEIGAYGPPVLRNNFANSPDPNSHHPPESSLEDEADKDAKDIMYMKLKELALSFESSDAPKSGHIGEIVTASNEKLGQESSLKDVSGEKNENIGEHPFDSSDHPSVIAQVSDLFITPLFFIRCMLYIQLHSIRILAQFLILNCSCLKE